MMRSVVFLASRPLDEGTELLVDYRLNPAESAKLPAWYQID
jgi:hypothetical protein